MNISINDDTDYNNNDINNNSISISDNSINKCLISTFELNNCVFVFRHRNNNPRYVAIPLVLRR